MDALFGLPRKKISGISYREALSGNIFFANQTSVDEFVNSYSERKELKVCQTTYSSCFRVTFGICAFSI